MEISDRLGLLSKVAPLLESAFEKVETDQERERLVETFGTALTETIDKAGPVIAMSLRNLAPRMLREHRKMRRGFEKRLQDVWGQALDAYYTVYVAASETGEEYHGRNAAAAAAENDLVFEALTGLHTRCCLAASEVYALLRTGHAAGAMARWRLMHECAVYSSLIGKWGRENGSLDLAERYLRHDAVLNERDAEDYQIHCASLGYEPFTDEEMESIRAEAEGARAQFGKSYGTQYGWARPLIPGNTKIHFADLERLADLAHLRPFYGWANHDVHADGKGARLNQLEFRGGHIRLAGPSNGGLADPGQSAAISLNQTTCAFIVHGRPEIADVSDLPILVALGELVNECCDGFIAAHVELERQEEAVLAALAQESQRSDPSNPKR